MLLHKMQFREEGLLRAFEYHTVLKTSTDVLIMSLLKSDVLKEE